MCSNANNVWGFEEADLSEEFVAEGRSKLTDYYDLLLNTNTYKAALANLFVDNACTVLKDEIQALTDEELAQNADFAALNENMKAMVLKVKNNTWESFTSSTGYTREGFEKFFRVRDDYYVYSNHSKMSWNEYTGMSNAFGKLSGPTGIVGNTGVRTARCKQRSLSTAKVLATIRLVRPQACMQDSTQCFWPSPARFTFSISSTTRRSILLIILQSRYTLRAASCKAISTTQEV